ncbi:MAG: sulfurtransferase [Alphaproteobacteria bacterium]|nr:sulfurtransferase [Alphaproteobacteria bacterium]
MKLRSLIAAAALAAAAAFPALGQPLVDTQWLNANLGKPGVVIIDLTSGGGRSQADYMKAHIPGAIFSDYAKGGWRVTDANKVPGMLPPPELLAKTIGNLGISNDSHVVIVPLGDKALDMGAAARVYWTMKVMGHDKVSILDGGFTEWAKIDPKTKRPVNQLATGGVKAEPVTFTVRLRKEMIVTAEDVKKAIENNVTLVDNRPNDFHLGLTRSPAAPRAGTIPGSKNIQESIITQDNGGLFRSRAQLLAIYRAIGVPAEGDQITFCNTGHWAALGWFASSEILGNKKTKMYDGSMAEWARLKDVPLEQKIKVE